METMPTMLTVKDLKKYFPLSKTRLFQRERPVLKAVDGVSLEIKKGEVYGLVGESGCGKSTFGRTLLGLYPPTSGEVFYRDKDGKEHSLTACKREELRRLRKELQIVFQDPYSSLNPRMTAGQIIGEGVQIHGFFPPRSRALQEYVAEIANACGLQTYMLQKYPHQFSGGQRQRLSIARALALKPRFVVCDECVSALDVSVQSQILNLLSDLKEKEGLTYLFISHDLSVVRYLSDRIAVMYLGQLMEWGSAEDVFNTPAHPYTVTLLAAVPGGKGFMDNGAFSMEEKREKPQGGCPFYQRCYMAKNICQRTPAPIKEISKGHFCACHFV